MLYFIQKNGKDIDSFEERGMALAILEARQSDQEEGEEFTMVEVEDSEIASDYEDDQHRYD